MRDELIFQLEYGYRFNLACERLYARLDTALNLVQLTGGSAAAMAVLGEAPAAVVASGLALALCSAFSLLVSPAVKAERYRASKAAFLTLNGRAAELDDASLAKAMRALQADGQAGIAALERPAYNAAVQALGLEHGVEPLTKLQRFVQLLA